MAAQRSCGVFLVKRDRPWLVSGILGPAVVINILVNLVVIPRWGAVGAALASSASYALSAMAFVLWVARVADRPFTSGVIISSADVRWVLNLLVPKFFRGRKEGEVD